MKPGDLIAHPEGGRFREVYRAATQVRTGAGADRAAVTHIYFALDPGEFSCFHRVTSDEIWNLYEGDGVRLHLWGGTSEPPTTVELTRSDRSYCHVVPAGVWQAAEPLGAAVLVGCTVAPGFEFADFTMLRAGTREAAELLGASPDSARLIAPPAT